MENVSMGNNRKGATERILNLFLIIHNPPKSYRNLHEDLWYRMFYNSLFSFLLFILAARQFVSSILKKIKMKNANLMIHRGKQFQQFIIKEKACHLSFFQDSNNHLYTSDLICEEL